MVSSSFNDLPIDAEITINGTKYGEIDSDVCSRYQIDISELFCTVEIVKRAMIFNHCHWCFCHMYIQEKMGDIMMQWRQCILY